MILDCFSDFAIWVLLDWLVCMCILLALMDFTTGYCLIGLRLCLPGLFQWFHIIINCWESMNVERDFREFHLMHIGDDHCFILFTSSICLL